MPNYLRQCSGAQCRGSLPATAFRSFPGLCCSPTAAATTETSSSGRPAVAGTSSRCAAQPQQPPHVTALSLQASALRRLQLTSAVSFSPPQQTLRAHKGGVTGLAVHPSGALALSVGRDRGLRLWDLVKGCVGICHTSLATPRSLSSLASRPRLNAV